MASESQGESKPSEHPENDSELGKPTSSKLTLNALCEDVVQQTDVKYGHGCARMKPEYILHDYKPKLSTDYLPADLKEKCTLETKELSDGATGISENISLSHTHDNSEHVPYHNSKDGHDHGSSSKLQKLKGRNKNRPYQKRAKAKDKMCPSIIKERTCNYGDNCRYGHDVKSYLALKPVDLGDQCFNFQTFGMCHFGVTCRYGSSHLTVDGKNMVNEEVRNRMKDKETVMNSLSHDLKVKLWKKRYDFTKANKIVKNAFDRQDHSNTNNSCDGQIINIVAKVADLSLTKLSSDNETITELANSQSAISSTSSDVHPTNSQSDDTSQNVPQPQEDVASGNLSTSNINDSPQSTAVETKASTPQCLAKDSIITVPPSQTPHDMQAVSVAAGESHGTLTNLGCLTDEGSIKLRPQEKKMIDFRDKLYLAPLTTVGNLPFRRLCKTYGADITCGEMALTTNLLQGQMSEWALLKRHHTEDIFGVQLCGGFPDTMTRCSQLLNENINVDFVDINCGCPIELVYQKGEGCAIMGKVNRFEKIISCMKSVLDVPLTIKMRMGIHDKKNIAHTLVPKLRDWGVSMVTIHGRSREQRYTKIADWEYIDMCARQASPMPIYGNGDILSYEEVMLHREATKVSGLMIARGALIKPWVFTEIKEQRHWDISATERMDVLRNFVNYGMEHWGSDQQGVDTTRRFLLEWLSFLHRYLPVGLLEVLPQRINEKPPRYQGRSDLETLFCSSNCADWIKISEMLLGPVPEDFTFLPKHKANAYQ